MSEQLLPRTTRQAWQQQEVRNSCDSHCVLLPVTWKTYPTDLSDAATRSNVSHDILLHSTRPQRCSSATLSCAMLVATTNGRENVWKVFLHAPEASARRFFGIRSRPDSVSSAGRHVREQDWRQSRQHCPISAVWRRVSPRCCGAAH